MPLSDEEKIRIREEEIYRDEVRAELNRTRSGRVWALLNSGFVLMLVSSVLIGGTLTYLQYETQKSAEAAERRQVAYEKQLEFIGSFQDHMESSVMCFVGLQNNKMLRACSKSRLDKGSLAQADYERQIEELHEEGREINHRYNDRIKPNALFAQARFLLPDKEKRIDISLAAFDRRLTEYQLYFRNAHDCAHDAKYREFIQQSSDEFSTAIQAMVKLMGDEVTNSIKHP